MHFLNPHFFHFAWLALIPLALYLFRKKARRVPVSTLLFFRSLSREHQESAWLRKLKKWLSLLLTLLVILLSVFALARPVSDAVADSQGAVVFVVDRSASMAAKDDQGRSRLEEAKLQMRQQLQALPDQIIVSLIAVDAKARVLLSRSRNRRECLRLLEELRPLPMEGHDDEALGLARRLAELETGSQIWHVGDAPFVAVQDLSYRFINVALPQVRNVGITGFQVRQAPLARDRHEAFVQVSAAAANATKTTSTLEVKLADRLIQLRELDLAPGESTSLILPLDGVRGQRLEIVLKTPGDCLGWDDAVAATLPQARPLLISWIADKPDPFTELALSSMIEAGKIEMLKGTSKAWPLQDKPDIYVFEHWLPPEWPTDRPVVILNPKQSLGPVQMRPLARALPHDQVRSVAPDHPILFRVSPTRLAVTQTGVLDLKAGFEPLWIAGVEPVLIAGEFNGQRVVVTAFSPAQSEQLALLPAFPLMLGNALYWCAETNAQASELKPLHPGEVLEEAGLVQWSEWDGSQFTSSTDQAPHGLLAVTRIGIWTAGQRSGSSVLTSAAETQIPSRSDEPQQKEPLPKWASGSSWGTAAQLLILFVLALLLLESFLFHRRAVF